MANKTEQRIMSASDPNQIREIVEEAKGYDTSNPKFFRRIQNAADARNHQLSIAAIVRADAEKRSRAAKKAAETRKANKQKVEKIGAALTKAINK